MKDNVAEVEKRIKKIKEFYNKTEDLLNSLLNFLPQKQQKQLKEAILGNKELKDLINGVDSNRPPRLFLIGRTGVGKSSLINAIMGSYVAKVDDVRSCTDKPIKYPLTDGNRVLMEVLDSRGISESERVNKDVDAEVEILNQINEFNPDAVIFVLGATRRDAIKEDVLFIKKVCDEYKQVNKMELPVVAVVNRCDELANAWEKKKSDYSQTKKQNINEEVQYYKKIIVENGLKIFDIIPVSSLIGWKLKDGPEIDVKSIENLPEKDKENLEIAFDGRYNIDELFSVLLDAIVDCEAKMGLRMAFRLQELVHNLSTTLIHLFAGIAAAIGAITIPISDFFILIGLQDVMVVMIASLSGRDVSFDTAKEFLASLSGTGLLGYAFKLAAKSLVKLIPVGGNVISAGVAATGTELVGNAAVSYYIDGIDMETVRKRFENAKKDAEMSNKE